MRFYQWYGTIAAVIFSSAAAAANCTPEYAVGKIADIVRNDANDSAWVMRADCPVGERTAAHPYQILYNGDRIEITGKTQVIVMLTGKEEKVFTQSTSRQSIQAKTKQHIRAENDGSMIYESLWIILADIIGKSRENIPIYSSSRGSNRLRSAPLLPSGLQYLPAGYDQVALLWQGGAANVIVATAADQFEKNSGNRAFALVPVPPGQQEIQIRLQGQEIGWRIATGTPPVAAGMNPSGPVSAQDRLMRALWILQQGPVEWRLFALSEFANLAQAGLFAAQELWDAARSGELAANLGIRQTQDQVQK